MEAPPSGVCINSIHAGCIEDAQTCFCRRDHYINPNPKVKPMLQETCTSCLDKTSTALTSTTRSHRFTAIAPSTHPFLLADRLDTRCRPPFQVAEICRHPDMISARILDESSILWTYQTRGENPRRRNSRSKMIGTGQWISESHIHPTRY